jgi:hypothetical protein
LEERERTELQASSISDRKTIYLQNSPGATGDRAS